ncbi:Phospholipase/carboxylesterase [Marasmius fiardii PR-910]|nr:Phospholipase/carboxylesterase [Marasmius fiardii PR-910]
MLSLEFISVPPSRTHTATVILLHGLGGSGRDWRTAVESFHNDNDLAHVKWVLPHAPNQNVTVYKGEAMPAWYDIEGFQRASGKRIADEEGMAASMQGIMELIRAENEIGIPYSRIILGGFSQGAAMTLLLGLTGEAKLAGLVSLSGAVPLRFKFKDIISPHALSVPIFWGHGSADILVTHELVEKSLELLESLGVEVRRGSKDVSWGVAFNIYNGLSHETNTSELSDLQHWLKNAIP